MVMDFSSRRHETDFKSPHFAQNAVSRRPPR